MAFAGGAQTQDETQRALGHAGLVGMRHDGGIEQCRRLRRILVREVSADEHLPLARGLCIGVKMMHHLRETLLKIIFHMLVPVRKFAEHLV